MQRQFFAFILTIFVLVTACQPIQPLANTAATPTRIPPPILTEMQIERWYSAVSDGQWMAEGLVAFPQSGNGQYYTELRVKKADGTVEWVPVTAWSEWGLGYTTPRPLRWSPDGRYLYFTNAPVPDGCGIFINASDLLRLDLVDGSVQEVLPPNTTWSLAVAPDGKTSVYSKGDELYLLDLATANYVAVKVEGLNPNTTWGNFVWSPGSQKVAFTIAHHPCMPPEWSNSLLIIDTQTLIITTVLEKDPRRLTIAAWVDAGHLALTDYDGREWLLDIAAGTMQETTEHSGILPEVFGHPTIFASIGGAQTVASFPLLVPAATISPMLKFVQASYQTDDKGRKQ